MSDSRPHPNHTLHCLSPGDTGDTGESPPPVKWSWPNLTFIKSFRRPWPFTQSHVSKASGYVKFDQFFFSRLFQTVRFHGAGEAMGGHQGFSNDMKTGTHRKEEENEREEYFQPYDLKTWTWFECLQWNHIYYYGGWVIWAALDQDQKLWKQSSQTGWISSLQSPSVRGVCHLETTPTKESNYVLGATTKGSW